MKRVIKLKNIALRNDNVLPRYLIVARNPDSPINRNGYIRTIIFVRSVLLIDGLYISM
jgi:hypothetical protein